MLKRYKNEFFKTIQSAGLDISDFSGEEIFYKEYPAFKITYTPGNIFFVARHFKDDPKLFDCMYAQFTGTNPPPEIGLIPEEGWYIFEAVISTFQRWLDNEVRVTMEEALIPDLWSQATSSFIEAHPIDSQEASNFTEEEREQIKLAASTFRLLVQETFAPTEDQRTVVAEQLAYLVSSVDRLNRFDWKAVAISTLMAISVALSLDTERGRQLYGLFQQAFSALTHLLR